jgi:glycine cleavage system H protein
MNIPDELLYTEDHEWAAIDDDVATVGISDCGQLLRGSVDAVDLPAVGIQLEAGRAFAVIHGEHGPADVYAPVSGEVVEINEELEDEPDMVNGSPYDGGWLIKIRMSDPDEVEMLLEAEDYLDLVDDAIDE